MLNQHSDNPSWLLHFDFSVNGRSSSSAHVNSNTASVFSQYLLVSSACFGHRSAAPSLLLLDSLPFSWHPPQSWLCRQLAAAPRCIYLSAVHLESGCEDGGVFNLELLRLRLAMLSMSARSRTCLASLALSRAMVAVSSARAVAKLLLACLVFKALISCFKVPRRTMASCRSFSPLDVSDSICTQCSIQSGCFMLYQQNK